MTRAEEQTVTEIRDRVMRNVNSYAAAEGLSYYGALQAAVRFGILAGIEHERNKATS